MVLHPPPSTPKHNPQRQHLLSSCGQSITGRDATKGLETGLLFKMVVNAISIYLRGQSNNALKSGRTEGVGVQAFVFTEGKEI
jgi:hypothetical protein